MPSTLFQQRRHTRRPPPTCKSSWRAGRIAETPFAPGVLTAWVRWIDLAAAPPVDAMSLIDVYAQAGPIEYFGSASIPGVKFTLSIIANANPNLYDVRLEIQTPASSDDDSWHGLQRPDIICNWDTEELSHVYTPGADENHCRISV